ncbi:MAG: PKD-like domain-containing protein, partial [bacterium]|nr:PKD-like domain-containing protein [bacterium]
MEKSVVQIFRFTLWIFLLSSNYISGQTIKNLVFSGGNHFCSPGTYTLSFDTTGNFGSTTFTAQLSNASGSFILFSNIGSSTSKSIPITIAGGLTTSANYAIRVVSNTLVITSDTLINMVLTRPTPNFTFSLDSACAGTNILFSNTSIGSSPFLCSWSFTGPSGVPLPTSNCNPVVNFNPGTGANYVTYQTSLNVYDTYGCVDSISKNIKSIQTPSTRAYATLLVGGNFSNVPNFSTNPDTIRKCNNTLPYLLTLANSSTTSSTNTSYTFVWGDTSSNTTTSTFTSIAYVSHNYLFQGNKSLQIISTGIGGCTSTATKYVYVGTNPSIGLGNPGNTTGECISKTYTFPITGFTGNSPGTNYLLSSNDKGPETSYVHPPPNSYTKLYSQNSCGFQSLGSYNNSFHLRITAVNACASSSATVEPIQLSSKPIANFSRISPSCINQNVTFTNTSISGKFVDPSPPNDCDTLSYPVWEISPSTGWNLISGTLGPVISGTNTIVVSFTLPGIYQVKLRIISPAYLIDPSFICGMDTVVKTICVQPIPIPNFSLNISPIPNCKPATVTATNLSNTILSCAPPVYTWTVRDSLTSSLLQPGSRYSYISGTDSNSINPVFSFTQKGRYVIQLKISNTCPGLYVKDTFIIIKDIPVVALQPDIIYCDSQALVFGSSNTYHNPTYDSSYGTISAYNWSITPTGFSYLIGNSGSRNPTVLFPNSTLSPITYRVILKATNECGISLPDTQLITINPKPIVTATPSSASFCSGVTTNILLSNNLPSGVTYTWRAYGSGPTIGGYNSQTLPFTSPINQTLINTGSVAGTVTYRIAGRHTATNCNGDSTTVTITVLPIPRVNALGETICSRQSTNIALNSTVAGSLFSWTASSQLGTTTGFSNQVVPISGPIVQTLVNSSSASADTIRYLIRATSNGCPSLDSVVKVVVNPLPVVFAGFDFLKCVYQPVFLLGGTPVGGLWTGTGVIGGNSFNPSSSGIGIYSLVYTYSDSRGCVNRDTVILNVIASPVPNFTISDSVGCSPLLVNFNNTSTVGVTAVWTFSNGSTYPGGNPFGITFVNPTNNTDASYSAKLVITAGTGCKDSITRNILVYP